MYRLRGNELRVVALFQPKWKRNSRFISLSMEDPDERGYK